MNDLDEYVLITSLTESGGRIYSHPRLGSEYPEDFETLKAIMQLRVAKQYTEQQEAALQTQLGNRRINFLGSYLGLCILKVHLDNEFFNVPEIKENDDLRQLKNHLEQKRTALTNLFINEERKTIIQNLLDKASELIPKAQDPSATTLKAILEARSAYIKSIFVQFINTKPIGTNIPFDPDDLRIPSDFEFHWTAIPFKEFELSRGVFHMDGASGGIGGNP